MRAVRFALCLSVLCAVLLSTDSRAQPYSLSSQSAPFVPVSASATRAQLAGTDPSDNGRATLPIGFAFPYFGRTYSQLTVTANGVAVFEPGSCGRCDFATNTTLPAAGAPDGVLAPFWDDLKLAWPTSGIFYETQADSFVVEWRELNSWFATSQYKITFQLRLTRSGELSFHYGPITGAGATLSASIGLEGPDGTDGTAAKPCTPACGISSLAPNELFTFAAPVEVELSVPQITLDDLRTVSDGGTDLEVTATTTLRNFSRSDAGLVPYALFLSEDRTYSPLSDVPMTPDALGPVDLAALSVSSHTATAVAPRPASGKWYVVALADPFGAFLEPNEADNTNASAEPFAAGIDLLARRVSGPEVTGPGEAVTLDLTVENAGIDDAPGAALSVKLVSAGTPDGGGVTVHTQPFALGPRENFSGPLSFNMPFTVAPGEFYWQVQLDPANDLAEEDEGNNVTRSTATTFVSQNDLVVEGLLSRNAAPPNDPASRLFFGESGRFDVTVRNIGGAATQNATLSLFISRNDTFNALSDTRIVQVPLSLAAGEVRTLPVTVTLPLVDRAGVTYVDGDYFIVALARAPADPDGANDIFISGPIRIFTPGPDLLVRSLAAPASLASGELFTLSRRFKNDGARDAGTASYRYFLSVNDIVTTGDIPLPLADGGSGFVTLSAGAEAFGFDDVVVPENLSQGNYFVGVIIDDANAVAEFDESNNAFAGPWVSVLGASLTLDSAALPDAVVDRPYRAQLTASGAPGPITFLAERLPAGLLLSAEGMLTGTPTEVGAHAVVVKLSAGARSTRTVAVLRVLANSSVLAVATTTLPPVQRERAYAFQLSAQGGAQPYRWSLVGGALPTGLVVSEDGVVEGSTAALSGPFEFTARVVDAVGTVAENALRLRVVNAGALVLQTSAPPPAQLGVEYATDFYAVNADGSPIATALQWSVVEGALPPGLSLDPRAQLLLLRGVPTRVGTFVFVLEVTDLEERSDQVSVVFQVYGSSSGVTGNLPPLVKRGESVSGQFLSEGATSFRLGTGRLPPGLLIDDAGALSGAVAEDAESGSYSFVVSATDGNGVERLGAFAIEVEAAPASFAPRCGCGAVDVTVAPLLLAVFALLRRRQAARRQV